MWNDPGSPWHAQTGGPLLCIYTFLYGAERDRGQTLCGGKGKTLHWATKQNVFVSPPPIHSVRATRRVGTTLLQELKSVRSAVGCSRMFSTVRRAQSRLPLPNKGGAENLISQQDSGGEAHQHWMIV